MADFSVGLDLGQTQDFTALCVVGLDGGYLKARRAREDAHERIEKARKSRFFDESGVRDLEREMEREERLAELPEPSYEVRHLERFALGTPYPAIVRSVKGLMDTLPLKGNSELAVDATGVGAAVVDMLRGAGLRFKSVVITGGEKESRKGNTYRVPKRNLISRPQVLLQEGNRHLKIAPTLPEAETLVEELLNYRYKITDSGNDTYGAWREGTRDDLVLALCLALWAAPKGTRAPTVDPNAYARTGPYGPPERPLYGPPRWS